MSEIVLEFHTYAEGRQTFEALVSSNPANVRKVSWSCGAERITFANGDSIRFRTQTAKSTPKSCNCNCGGGR